MGLNSIYNGVAANINIGSIQLPEQTNAAMPAILKELVPLILTHLPLPHKLTATLVCKAWKEIGVKQIITEELRLYGQFIQEMIYKLDPKEDEKVINALKALKNNSNSTGEGFNVNDLAGLKPRLQALKDGTIKALMGLADPKNSRIIKLDFKLQTERPLLFKNLRTVISIKKAVQISKDTIRDQIRRALKENELNLAESIVKGLPLEGQAPMQELISVSSLLSQRKLDEAEKIADSISGEWERSVALEKIGQYLLSQNKLDEALKITDRMPNLCIKSCAFYNIAAKMGSLIEQNTEISASMKEEEERIYSLSDPHKRKMAINEFATKKASASNFIKHYELLEQEAGNLLDKAKNAIEEAAKLASSLSESSSLLEPSEKELAVLDVAYSLTLQNKIKESQKIIREIQGGSSIATRFKSIFITKANYEMKLAECKIMQLAENEMLEQGGTSSLWLQNEFKNLKVRLLCNNF